jgi:hypothetical protein
MQEKCHGEPEIFGEELQGGSGEDWSIFKKRFSRNQL